MAFVLLLLYRNFGEFFFSDQDANWQDTKNFVVEIGIDALLYGEKKKSTASSNRTPFIIPFGKVTTFYTRMCLLMIIIVALHNGHIFRHKFILISINITHYCHRCVCAMCGWLVLLMSRLFLCR